MTILFHCPWPNKDLWLELLRGSLPEEEFVVYPDLGAPEEIDIAMVWTLPVGALSHCHNLKAVLSLGAGVDHLLGEPGIGEDILVGRLPDPYLPLRMADYVLAQILNRQIRLPDYVQAQIHVEWARFPRQDSTETKVAILGLGQLGLAVAEKLYVGGFQVSGWSRSAKQISGVDCYHGTEGWRSACKNADHVVCLLPLTAETENLIDAEFLSQLRPNTHLINCARGGHVVDTDLISALDQGQLDWATLDVFRQEPLPATHPFWSHPRITVTPHVSSPSEPTTCVALLKEQVVAIRSDEVMPNQVDLQRGY